MADQKQIDKILTGRSSQRTGRLPSKGTEEAQSQRDPATSQQVSQRDTGIIEKIYQKEGPQPGADESVSSQYSDPKEAEGLDDVQVVKPQTGKQGEEAQGPEGGKRKEELRIVDPKEEKSRQLQKTDAKTKLHEAGDLDLEAALAEQVMRVSPRPGEASTGKGPREGTHELKESLKQDNFFLKNIDAQGREEPKSSSIKIQINDDPSKPQPDTISPLSGASSEIKHGGMSLSPESSTSGENREKLQAVIAEIAKYEKAVEDSPLNKEQRAFADELTMEILKHLVGEMKHDWEVLVNREAAQLLKQQ